MGGSLRSDLAKKVLRPVLGQNEATRYEVAYGAKPGQLLVRTPREYQRLYMLEGGELTPITPELDVSKLAPATLESYPARDGTKIRCSCDGRHRARRPAPSSCSSRSSGARVVGSLATLTAGAFEAGAVPVGSQATAREVKLPLLLLGAAGPALQIHDELAERGVPCELILFTSERDKLALTIGHTIAFFEKHLEAK